MTTRHITKGLVGQEDLQWWTDVDQARGNIAGEQVSVPVSGLKLAVIVETVEALLELNVDNFKVCILLTAGEVDFYTYDADSDTAESPPNILVPNSGMGRWRKQSINNARSVIQIQIYQRASTMPNTPLTGSITLTTNSFTITAPVGWFTSIPDGSAPLYTSSTLTNISFPEVGSTTSNLTDWSQPALLAAMAVTNTAQMGSSIKIIFTKSDTTPVRPGNSSDLPENWFNLFSGADASSTTGHVFITIGQTEVGSAIFAWGEPTRFSGAAGADGSRFNWRGDWVAGTSYTGGGAATLQDIVRYEGRVWLCIQTYAGASALLITSPLDSPALWQLLVRDGTAGTAGATGSGFVWQGAWSNTAAYQGGPGSAIQHIVSHNTMVWLCIRPHTGSTPAANNVNWQLFVRDGIEGATGSGFNWRGTWVPGQTYQGGPGSAIQDVVRYTESIWLCIFAHTGRTTIPDADIQVWQLLLAKPQDGNTGLSGAGLYTASSSSGTFPSSNAAITTLFASSFGRPPVNFDTFTLTNSTQTTAVSRLFRNGTWEAVAARIDGNLLVGGTVRADTVVADSIGAEEIKAHSVTGNEIQAGISLSAPLIMGGSLILNAAGYNTILSAAPVGPDNLTIWYGPSPYNSAGAIDYSLVTEATGELWFGADGRNSIAVNAALVDSGTAMPTMSNLGSRTTSGNSDTTINTVMPANATRLTLSVSYSYFNRNALRVSNPSCTIGLYSSSGAVLVTKAISGTTNNEPLGGDSPRFIVDSRLSGSVTATTGIIQGAVIQVRVRNVTGISTSYTTNVTVTTSS